MAIKIAFFDTKSYDRESFEKLNKDFGFDIHYYKERLSMNTVALAKGKDVVCIFVNAECDHRVIDELVANGVKLIALRCAGFNNVEVYRSVYRTREGNFKLNGLLGFDMYGKTVGLIGMGRIAKELIKICRGFGMNVVAYDLYPDHAFAEEHQVKIVTLDELYEESDIISLHCPLTEETKFIINNESITKMKYGAIIINTGRGKLIKTEDLIDGLRTHQLGGAALDVYEEEQNYFYEDRSDKMIDDDKLALLLMMPNVIVTSHQAFFTREALHNIGLTTLQNIKDCFDGKELANEVKA